MPNTRSAIKTLRQDKKKHERNQAAKAELRTITKTARKLIEENNKIGADEALKKLESKLYRAAKSNIIRKENASRRISRLRSQWSKLEG